MSTCCLFIQTVFLREIIEMTCKVWVDPTKGPVLWFGQKSKNWIKLIIFINMWWFSCMCVCDFSKVSMHLFTKIMTFSISQCTKLLLACNPVPKCRTTDCLKMFKLGWVLGLLPLSEFCPCNKASLWLYLKFALPSPLYPCFYLNERSGKSHLSINLNTMIVTKTLWLTLIPFSIWKKLILFSWDKMPDVANCINFFLYYINTYFILLQFPTLLE